jgi:ChrB-like protein
VRYLGPLGNALVNRCAAAVVPMTIACGNAGHGNASYTDDVGWIVLIYRLPAGESRARVAVWRELRRSGALHLQQSVVVAPDAEAFRGEVERLREVISGVGGQVTALRAESLDPGDDERFRAAWNEARDEQYRELKGECAKFLAEIDHEFAIEKFTLAELDEEEAEMDKLRRWHERIRRLDVHDAAGAAAALEALATADAALDRYSQAVFERTQP